MTIIMFVYLFFWQLWLLYDLFLWLDLALFDMYMVSGFCFDDVTPSSTFMFLGFVWFFSLFPSHKLWLSCPPTLPFSCYCFPVFLQNHKVFRKSEKRTKHTQDSCRPVKRGIQGKFQLKLKSPWGLLLLHKEDKRHTSLLQLCLTFSHCTLLNTNI